MDTNFINNLLKFGYILTEADNGGQGKADKTTDKDRYFRLIEDELKDYFSLPGFVMDDSVRMEPDIQLGHGDLSAAARQQQEARLASLGVDADETLESNEDGYRMSEFLRVYITGLFIHPSSVGGWGIGNSQTARAILESIASDPSNRGAGGTRGAMNPDSLKNPNTYPDGLKNYIALLSKKFIRGMIRIGFDECGLMSYLLHENPAIMRAVLQTIGNGEEEYVKTNVPANWDYDKLYHLSHVIIPQFVLKTMVAPAAPTPNCDKALIEQSAAYLGDEDLRIIQSYVTPVETGFDTNLCPSGSKEPADYNDLARYAGAWNFSVAEIKERASFDEHGTMNVYTPPTKDMSTADLMRKDEGSLVPRYTTSPNEDGAYEFEDSSGTHREYPSEKFGAWSVVDVDNDQDHARDNVDRLNKGYTVLVDQNGNPYKFWFRGGKTPTGPSYAGVGNWCWTARSCYYDNYRKIRNHDRGYMLINEHALDKDVLDTEDNDLGSPFDSTAFGVVVAGSTDSGIPGLMKPTCFQGRQDRTGESSRPGSDHEVHYDERFVPNGGKIPGLIDYGRWSYDYSDKRSIAASINNSIFCLALIGKWDGSIKVSNGKFNDPDHIEFYTDELISLMQKWFPVNLASKRRISNERSSAIKLMKVDDLSTIGRLLSDASGDDNMSKDLLLSVFRTENGDTWHLLHSITDDDQKVYGCILVPADDEFKLKGERSNGTISKEQYDVAIGNLPALMFTRDDSDRFVPFMATKLTVDNALMMIGQWQMNKERPIRERIGNSKVTPMPGTEDTGDEKASIHWAPPMSSAGKHRTVGFSNDMGIWVSGPETGNEPKRLVTDSDVAGILNDEALRSTYIVTDGGEYNIWITAEVKKTGGTELYIAYIRKERCRLFKMLGTVLGFDTTNAVLVARDRNVVLGNLKGDLARLNNQNSDRYTLFLDMSSLNENGSGDVIDGAGLYNSVIEDMGLEFHGCVGLGVSNGRIDLTKAGDSQVGTMDWYDAVSMEFIRTTPITLDMIPRNHAKIPRDVTI